MAASEARRDVFYYTFNDKDLSADLNQISKFFEANSVRVGKYGHIVFSCELFVLRMWEQFEHLYALFCFAGDLFRSIPKYLLKPHPLGVLWFVKEDLEKPLNESTTGENVPAKRSMRSRHPGEAQNSGEGDLKRENSSESSEAEKPNDPG